MNTRILRMREVMQRIGLSRSTIYKLMENDDFPRPMKLGSQAIGWRDADIEAWIESRPLSSLSRPEARRRKPPRLL